MLLHARFHFAVSLSRPLLPPLILCFLFFPQAFTPIITMVSLFVARLETPSRRLILSVSFIALGTAIASAGEVNLSWTGVAIMLLSELFESVRLVMTQLLLTGLRFHPSETARRART
jgi:hypothetical protein